jgi:hypothetical protein
MEGVARGVLTDLLAATEAVGYEDGLRIGLAYGGQEDAIGEDLRDFELFALEAERASHAAAAGVEMVDVGSGAAEEVELGVDLHDGFVVAVGVDDELLSRERWRLEAGRVAGEEVAE